MATASKTNQLVEVIKTELVSVFTLTLSAEEASVLRAVCGKVGGDSLGPRGKMDAINGALALAGASYADLKTDRHFAALYIS